MARCYALSINPSVRPSVHLSVHLSVHPSVHPSIRPPVHPSVPSIRPSVHPSVRQRLCPGPMPEVVPWCNTRGCALVQCTSMFGCPFHLALTADSKTFCSAVSFSVLALKGFSIVIAFEFKAVTRCYALGSAKPNEPQWRNVDDSLKHSLLTLWGSILQQFLGFSLGPRVYVWVPTYSGSHDRFKSLAVLFHVPQAVLA